MLLQLLGQLRVDNCQFIMQIFSAIIVVKIQVDDGQVIDCITVTVVKLKFYGFL